MTPMWLFFALPVVAGFTALIVHAVDRAKENKAASAAASLHDSRTW